MPRGILDIEGVSSNSKHCKYWSLYSRARAACWLCMLSGSSDVTRAIGFKQVLVNANPLVAVAMLEKVVPANGMHQPPGISASPPLLHSFGIVQHAFVSQFL